MILLILLMKNYIYAYIFQNLFNLSLPPFVVDDGSTANTAIFSPLPVKNLPKLSRNVLLPAPGGPDKPIQQILMRILAWMGNNKRMA